MLGNRQKLRFLYLALCASQLAVMGLGIIVAYQVQRSYSRNIEYEKSVNAERQVLNQLELLARGASPGSVILDDSSMPNELSGINYSSKLFLQKAQPLLSQSEAQPNSPAGRSHQDIQELVDQMSQLAQQGQLAREALAQNDSALAHARLVYMDRYATQVQTILGDINLELSRTKDAMLLTENAEAGRAKLLLGPLSLLGMILLFPALLYARRLDGAIWAYEEELEDQRNLLERRVGTRTSELQTEIDYRKRMEAFNDGRNRLMEKLVAGRGLEEVLSELVREAEQSVTGSRSLILVSGSHDRPAIAPNLQTDLAASVGEALRRGWDTGPLETHVGTTFIAVVDPKQRVVFADAWSKGFRGILAVPITEPKQPLLGVIALLLREPRDPGEFAREVLLSASRMASVALEHNRMQGELFRRAHHDPLTDLPNRGLFEDRLQQAVAMAARRKTSVGVLCIDLDGFKQVNDRYGHEAGDWLLRQVAQRLTSRMRKTDTVARLGGDEFVAVVHDAREGNGVATFCGALVRTIAEPYSFGNVTLKVTASIGAALYPADGTACTDLRRQADMAMYRAKERGRNTFEMFSAGLGEKLARHKQIEGHLQDALENREFDLHYQPIYTVNRALIGVEALIRFRRPELESISPGEFMPVAEQTGQVPEIGEWVLREACRQVKQWQDEGCQPVPVAVNVSAIQLARSDFAKLVARILQEMDLESAWLHVEITETAVMSDFEEGLRQLDALAKLGVHISIDDFGTGHSSLSYIHRLPIKTLKIDRSFVQAMMESQESSAIVRAIIAMAQSLGLTVIAEGVETEEQLNALATAGCDLAQGYLLGRPLVGSSVNALLEQQASSALDAVAP